jgi:hypothetical protein
MIAVGVAVAGIGSQAIAADERTGRAARAAESTSTTAMIGLVPWQEEQLLAERDSGYRYIVVRDVLPSTRRGLVALVTENPRTKVLLYTDAGFMIHNPADPMACEYWPFNGDGADFCTATKHHESWFLHRAPAHPGEPAKARRLRSEGYRASWAADIADPSYQRRWIRNVLKRLRGERRGSGGTRVAGVFMDDLNIRPGHGLDGRIAEYSDEAYGTAAVGFAARTAQRLQRAGFMTMANVGVDPNDPAQRAGLLQVAAAGVTINREYFVRYDSGSPVFTSPAADRGTDWLIELELFEQVQAAGGAFLGLVYGAEGQVAAAQYARATFLLGWDGRSASAMAFRTEDESNPATFEPWQTEIGTPVEARARFGEHQTYIRHFSRGVAAVNADPASPQLTLLGGLYRNRSGLCVSAIYLQPASGAVMPRCLP